MNFTKEHEEKLNLYLDYLEQDPNNFNLLLSISESYRHLGDLSKAQSYLDRAKTIDSEACLHQQALIDLKMGRFNQAKETYLKLLEQEENSEHRYALAFCHYFLDEMPEGIEILSPLLVKGSTFYEAEILMARMYRQQYRLDEAIRLLKSALESHGPLEDTYALLAEIYFDREELELAEETAEKALTLAPDNFEAKVIRALLGISKHETDIEEIEELLARNSKDPRLWFALGSLYLIKGNFAEAETAFCQAANLEPLFCDNWVSLAWCQLLQDKPEEAKINYQQALDVYEESPEAHGGLAIIDALHGELAQAKNKVARAKELDPKCFLADIAKIIYSQPSDLQKASKEFNQRFPTFMDKLNAAMSIAVAEMDKENSVIH